MDYSVCTASTSSMTYALKAQRALANAAIPSRIVRLDGGKTRKGCAYGIEFSCLQLSNVKTVLNSVHISVRHYFNGDTEL